MAKNSESALKYRPIDHRLDRMVNRNSVEVYRFKFVVCSSLFM